MVEMLGVAVVVLARNNLILCAVEDPAGTLQPAPSHALPHLTHGLIFTPNLDSACDGPGFARCGLHNLHIPDMSCAFTYSLG